MSTFKRIFRWIATNIAIIIMINIILAILQNVFGVTILNGSYQGLLIFATIFGFAGSFISLQMSKWTAKRAYKIKMIDSMTADAKLRTVYQTVQQIASQHGITMPEVGYYNNPTANAFATGASKNKSLVAVSTGLLENMNENELRAVVGHEMAHILNGDMVTMTLLQGVLNTFVIFFARVIAMAINTAMRDDNDGGGLGGMTYLFVVIALDTVLSMIASLVLMAYSRKREYAADAGSAQYLGSKHYMIDALRKLGSLHKDTKIKQDAYATMKIAGGKTWMNLFRSHPTMEKRIEALQNLPV